MLQKVSAALGVGAAPQPDKPWAPFFVRKEGVLLLIALYIGIQFFVRLLIAPGLGFDDSEQVLLGQSLQWGYGFRQPPLYTWISWSAFQLFGYGLFAVTLVNYGLLGLGYVFIYLAARRLTGDDLRAALILFCYPLIYVFAYYALHDLTHTVLMSSVIAANLYFFIGMVQRGRWSDSLLFGLTLGLGTITKYNFLIYALCILLIVFLLPQVRARLNRRRCLIGLALGVLVALPHLIWVVNQSHSVFSMTNEVVKAESGADTISWLEQRLVGLLKLAMAILEFPQPLLVVVAILLPQLLFRPASGPDPNGLRRVLGLQILCGLGLMLAVVLILGASQIKARWLHPILLTLPFFLFMRSAADDLPLRRVKLFVGVAGVAILLALGGRFVEDRLREANCRICRAHWPIAELAQQLHALGFERGTMMVANHHLGGNLLPTFPDSRAIEPANRMGAFPADPVADQCLIVWEEEQPTLPENIDGFLKVELGVALGPQERDGVVSAAFGPNDERRYGLSYILIDGGMGDCR